MKVTFITNYMTHHQLPFCQEMYSILGDDFIFIETNSMDSERKSMGWDKAISECPFIKKWDDEEGNAIVRDSDIVLCGGTHEVYLRQRMGKGKITFRYFERLYKTGRIKAFIPTSYIRKYKEHTKRKNEPVYLLCAGAYVAADFSLFGAYKNKMFKWGYFTKTSEESFSEITAKRNQRDNKDGNTVKILWTGRMLDWKHPELAIDALKAIADKGMNNVSLTMIGEGMMRKAVENLVSKYELSDKVKICDFVNNEEVRSLMEEHDIYLMTSDFNEGWGAVVNEAMDKGMTVIASHGAGASPYLIENNVNGLIYKCGNKKSLADKLERAVLDEQLRYNLGGNAYNTIHELWNGKVGAERFVNLCEHMLAGTTFPEFTDGPLSKAPVVSPLRGFNHYAGKK